MKLLICILGCVVACQAHMCLVEPHQRGKMDDINGKGVDDCILLTGPCGGRPAEKAHALYSAGDNYTVIFQKNLDHHLTATPGFFLVNLLSADMKTNKELARIPDSGEPPLTLYTAAGKLPTPMVKGNYILQVCYVTKNPQAPPIFYQCADIVVQ